MMSRMHVHVKEQARLLSTRPTLDELHGQRLYIHPDVRSADVCDRCALLHLTPSEDFSEKPNIYCTANTEDLRLRFAAMLTGGWIIDKAVLLGLPGISVLYTATPTPRHIWVSEDFQLEDPEAWELMQSFLGRGKLWTLILNAEDFVAKKGMRSFTTNEMSEVCVIRDVCPSDCPKSKNLGITSSSQQYLSNLHPMLTK